MPPLKKSVIRPSQWKTGIRVKIKRAEQHIRDLERRRVRAFKKAPYRVVAGEETQPRWREYIWRKTRRTPVPPLWGAVTADAINNLRSALDILWKQATDPTARRSPFPLAPADKLKARMNGAKPPAIKKAFRLLLDSEVYEGGSNDISAFHEAWNSDKHEMPLIVACAFTKGAVRLESPKDIFFSEWQVSAREPISVEDGEPFASVMTHRQLYEEGQFVFDIAFGKGTALRGKPVVAELTKFASITKGIAESFFIAKLVT